MGSRAGDHGGSTDAAGWLDTVDWLDARAGSVTSRIQLGRTLRRYREREGISRVEAGRAIAVPAMTISGVELGQVSVRLQDVVALCELYRVDDLEMRARLLSLAREASVPNWWAGFSEIIPDWFRPYLALEDSAERIRSYDLQFVPGLLQHPDYARAVIGLDKRVHPVHDLEHRLALRLLRQRRVTSARPPKVWAIIDESVLRRPIGSRKIMFRQLQHLADLCDQPSVTLQILPFSAAAHAPGAGPFILLSLPDDLPDVVYLEQLTTALYLDQPNEVDHYRHVLNLLALLACKPMETPAMLREMMGEL